MCEKYCFDGVLGGREGWTTFSVHGGRNFSENLALIGFMRTVYVFIV